MFGKFEKRMSGTQMIALGFLLLIFIGTILLMLPVSSRNGEWTPFITALFTSTSATCVTGLVLVDTFTHWSIFGQLVLLVLIQIGGLGFITIGITVSLMLRKKIGLKQRGLIKESLNTLEIGGVVRLVRRVIGGTFLFEMSGAFILTLRFLKDMDVLHAIYYGIFHSISAFCNAGFDLMGRYSPFSSITRFYNDPVVILTISALILIGGIGFFVWNDLREHGLHCHHYALQTKMVLSATAVCLFGGTLLFYLFEHNRLFAGMSFGEQLLNSFFCTVTPRTAGFNTADFSKLTESGQMLTIILMLIGGSPGSTAGGMKTTTLAVLTATAVSVFRRNENPELFKRRIAPETVANAASILMMYLSLCLTGAFLISRIEDLPMMACMFETASAVGTVGLSFGITPGLGSISRIILIILMYLGRVGGLTLIYAALSGHRIRFGKYPLEKITVG